MGEITIAGLGLNGPVERVLFLGMAQRARGRYGLPGIMLGPASSRGTGPWGVRHEPTATPSRSGVWSGLEAGDHWIRAENVHDDHVASARSHGDGRRLAAMAGYAHVATSKPRVGGSIPPGRAIISDPSRTGSPVGSLIVTVRPFSGTLPSGRPG